MANLGKYRGKQVYIYTQDGVQIQGFLSGFDSSMNLMLEDVIQYRDEGWQRRIGKLFLPNQLVMHVEYDEFVDQEAGGAYDKGTIQSPPTPTRTGFDLTKL